MVARDELVKWLNDYLDIDGIPDYPNAYNGLQIEGKPTIKRIATSVDFCEATVKMACDAEADMLLVHHGVFWSSPIPLTSRSYRRISPAISNGLNVYSSHLPLDRHSEVGNNVQIAKLIGASMVDEFFEYKGTKIGIIAEIAEMSAKQLVNLLQQKGLESTLHMPNGRTVNRLAICSGGAGDAAEAASQCGCDALLTGEAAHHQLLDAEECGVSIILGGHYQTERYGVQALGALLSELMHLEAVFLDHPTGR